MFLCLGIDLLQKAISAAVNGKDPSLWRTCLIEITVSSVKSTDCSVGCFAFRTAFQCCYNLQRVSLLHFVYINCTGVGCTKAG